MRWILSKGRVPATPDTSLPAQRLLNDREIEIAIRRRFIVLDNPDFYLENKDKLIQPASMDVLLHEAEDVTPSMHHISLCTHEGRNVERRFSNEVHKDVDGNYVTFWPGHETEVFVRNLRDYSPDWLASGLELRSTLRRAGLDVGIPFTLRRGHIDDFMSMVVRNPRNYPISVEKGAKIAQVLWYDRRIQNKWDADFIEKEWRMLYDLRPFNIGSGIPIINSMSLMKLVESGDVNLSPRTTIENGVIVFHAGRKANYLDTQHVIVSKDKPVQGINLREQIADEHVVPRGGFVDIETQERVRLSPRVGMQVSYAFSLPDDTHNWDFFDSIDNLATKSSLGGWIDPGYGFGKKEGAVFSVQRKAFMSDLEIKSGERVAWGLVYFFPDGVGKEYGEKRGSHYNHADGFEAPKV